MEVIFADKDSSFDEEVAKQQIAKSTGVTADQVQIEDVHHKVQVTYTFGATVPVEDARKAIAEANGVSVDKVTVTMARRLLGSRLLSSHVGVDVTAVIEAGSAAEADVFMDNAEKAKEEIVTKLEEAGHTTTIAVKEAPKKKVEFKTKIVSTDKTPVAQPPRTALQTLASGLGGIVNIKDVVLTPGRDAEDEFDFVPVEGAPGLHVAFGLLALILVFLP